MPQHPVPVFGGWESNNQTYTLIFDNVRAEKGSKKINPNDPEFFFSLQEQQAQPENLKTQEDVPSSSPRAQPVSKRQNHIKHHGNLDTFPRSLNAGLTDIGDEGDTLSHNNYNAEEEKDSSSSISSAESAGSPGINLSENWMHPRSAQMRSDVVDDNQLARERPEADHGMKENNRYPQSPSQTKSYQGRLGNRAGMNTPGRSMPGQVVAPVPWSQRSRGTTRADETPAVLPPFGAWDANNPASAEEYTAIFTVLREEKRAGISPAHASLLQPAETRGRKTEEVRQPAPQPKKTWRWRRMCACSASDVDGEALMKRG